MKSRCVNPVITDGTAALETAVAKARRPDKAGLSFSATAQWMNDVNGPLFHKGNYHIFYQLNPYKPHVGDGIHWGHARSRDLVYWEHLPLAIHGEGRNRMLVRYRVLQRHGSADDFLYQGRPTGSAKGSGRTF